MTLVLKPKEIYSKRLSEGRLGMLEIAEGWTTKPLGELIELLNGAPFDSNLFNRVGKGKPLIRIRDVGKDDTETWFSGDFDQKYLVTSGDVLVGLDGDFRVAEWHGSEALLNQRVCKLVPREDLLDKRFMVYHLAGWLDAIWEETSATTVKHLSSKTIQEIPFPLPPIEEQKRIVEALDDHLSRLDKALAELLGVEPKLGVFRRSAIEALTAGDETWTTSALGDVANVNWGDTSLTKSSYQDKGFTAFSASGPDGFLDKYDFDQDGLVLSAIGAACGKVFFATGRWSGIKNTICITPKDESLSAKYLYYFLNDANGWQKRGAAQPFIRQADARARLVRYPDITRQLELIETLEAQIAEFEILNKDLSAQIERLHLLRRSVLKSAFEGTL